MNINKIKRIAYVSGTRADFGLMTSVLREISQSKNLHLDMYAIGMHLMPKFGYTYAEVKKYYPLTKKIEAIQISDTKESVSKFFSICLSSVITEFIKKRPDVVLVLGDRAEMLAVATACLYLHIPVAHVHGGDCSGTVDETTRHVITKLSHIHFPANCEAATRIEKMGEEKWRIHSVGSPSLDTILKQKFLSRNEICRFLHILPKEKYMLVTIHPEGLSEKDNKRNIREIMVAIQALHLPVIIIYPNADEGSETIIAEIEKHRKNPLFHIFENIPYMMFLSIEKEASVWIGNSSSGIIESPSFRVPVVNVGVRQTGRTTSPNIINVPYEKKRIEKAISTSLTDKEFLRMIKKIRNPWGDGKASIQIVRVLNDLKINDKLLNKKFCDMYKI